MSCCAVGIDGLDLPESAVFKRPRRARRRGGSAPTRPSSFALGKRPPKLRIVPSRFGALDCLPEDENWQAPSGEEDVSPNAGSGRRGLSAPPQVGQERNTDAQNTECDQALSWPSLREGAAGWDFHSDASETLSLVTDADSDTTAASWIDVQNAEAIDHCGDVPSPCGRDESSMNELPAEEVWQTVGKKKGKNSFSQVLCKGSQGPNGKAQDCAKAIRPAESKVLPKSLGLAAPLAVTTPSARVAQQTTSEHCIDSDDDFDYQETRDCRLPGWNKRHKASHNMKYRTKVQYQVNKRNEQRLRGC
mmetsp:Transcript_50001/g.96552  ORF Transcript_50001/g.96552 Transcript_50001/m.96552 type:complete len:304 (+) Transcript_50001:85-996(+)